MANQTAMAPRIGITASSGDGADGSYNQRVAVNTSYVQWIERHGGLPLVLPNVSPDLADALLDSLDGLLLSGGADVHPLLYDTEPHAKLGTIDVPRDRFELPLARRALARELPILGICRGIQVLNVAAGGTLRQDLPSDPAATVQHAMRATGGPTAHHRLSLVPGTRLGALLGTDPVAVNSYHHQAVDRVAAGFRVAARAADQVIEAIEGCGERFLVGVQFHPEVMPPGTAVSEALFEAFLTACGRPV